jgi:hypothetical protein
LILCTFGRHVEVAEHDRGRRHRRFGLADAPVAFGEFTVGAAPGAAL